MYQTLKTENTVGVGTPINLENSKLEWLAHKQEEQGTMRSMAFEQCTEEDFQDYKNRQKERYKSDQIPETLAYIEVCGMKATKRLSEPVEPINYNKVMKNVWRNVLGKYPPTVYKTTTFQIPEGDHVVIRVVVMPLAEAEWLEEETKIALGYRDFDSVDFEFDIIQNCESSKFSAEQVFGLSIDYSRDAEDESNYQTITEEEELMTNLGMSVIPDVEDVQDSGFLLNLAKEKQALSEDLEKRAKKW